MIKPATSGQTQGVRDSKGRFVKGVSGNPLGPKPGFRMPALQEMAEAIQKYRDEKNCTYWQAIPIIAIDLAQKGNTSLLCKIIDKFVANVADLEPDKTPETLPFVVEMPDVLRN